MVENNVWIPDGQLGEQADYKKQVIFDYEGNPLIEALPAIMSKDEFSSAVTYYPPYKDEERFLGSEYRLHCVMRLLKYFQPMGKHIDLEQRISRVLRYGYLARNPLLPEYKARLRELKKMLLAEFSNQKEVEELKHRVNDADTPTSGFTVIGVSGVGKTTALKKIIQLYSQVILHSMGSIYWERFKIETDTEKKLWNFLIKELFAHQWTEEKADFDEEFSQVLYDESQGVTDIAVKLYMLSQFRAIVTPKIKKIAPSLMRQVALDSLKLVRPMLDALRSGEPERIARYADIDPIDIEEFYEGYKAKLNIHEQKRLEQLREKMKAQVNHAPELNQIISGLLDLDIPPKTAKMFAEKALAVRENDDTLAKLTKNAYQLALAMPSVTIAEPPPPSKESKPVKSPKKYATGDLRIIVSEAKLSQVSAYEGLQNNGVIKHPLTEFAIA